MNNLNFASKVNSAQIVTLRVTDGVNTYILRDQWSFAEYDAKSFDGVLTIKPTERIEALSDQDNGMDARFSGISYE